MFGITPQNAFRLLRRKHTLLVLQPDPAGVIRKLTDARGQPFHIKAKKVRRMLAGKQSQALCVSGKNGEGNAFFVRADELVALDPLDGRYVIVNPLLEVIDAQHRDRAFQGSPGPKIPRSARPSAPSAAPCVSTAQTSEEVPCPA